jgi:hypothetical protein
MEHRGRGSFEALFRRGSTPDLRLKLALCELAAPLVREPVPTALLIDETIGGKALQRLV